MPKKVKPEEKVEETTPAVAVDVTEPVEPEEESPKAKKAKSEVWPEATRSGKFHAVAHEDGFVVFNPDGARVTGVISDAKAKDLVAKSNRDAGIKIR